MPRHQDTFKDTSINIEKALSARSLVDFDNHFSCPLLGYKDPGAYYTEQSCSERLHMIRSPVLLLNAADDPLLVPGLVCFNAALHAIAERAV